MYYIYTNDGIPGLPEGLSSFPPSSYPLQSDLGIYLFGDFYYQFKTSNIYQFFNYTKRPPLNRILSAAQITSNIHAGRSLPFCRRHKMRIAYMRIVRIFLLTSLVHISNAERSSTCQLASSLLSQCLPEAPGEVMHMAPPGCCTLLSAFNKRKCLDTDPSIKSVRSNLSKTLKPLVKACRAGAAAAAVLEGLSNKVKAEAASQKMEIASIAINGDGACRLVSYSAFG